MKHARLLALTLVAALGASTLAQAQPAPQPGMAGPGGGGWNRGEMRQRMEAHRAEHIKALHDALNIRPDQESAFQAFAASMTPEHRGERGHDRMDPAADAAMTTPQRLDRMGQMMDRRIADMREDFQRRATATRTLYAALSPDQRRTLDALPDLRGGDHGPMDHDHGMDHGRGGPGGPGEDGGE